MPSSYSSFNELSAESNRLRSSGDRVAALELLAREEPHFPHQAGLARILQVELLVELGRNVEAIARLRDGLDRGFRYRGWWFARPSLRGAGGRARFHRPDRTGG